MNDTIKVLLVKPLKPPQVVEIPDTLESMQKAVGGDIEAVYPFEDPVAIVCNSEGKLYRMPPNRALRDGDGEIYDIVVGDFFICGLGSDNFASLSDEHIKKFGELFKTPEVFFRQGDSIIAVPLMDSTPNRHNNDAR